APTAIGNTLVKAWLADVEVVAGGRVAPGLLVHVTPDGASLGQFTQRLAVEWCDACYLLGRAAVPPSWVQKTRLVIDAGSRLIDPALRSKYQGLLIEAVAEL